MREPVHFNQSENNATKEARDANYQSYALLPRKPGHKPDDESQSRDRYDRERCFELKCNVCLVTCR